MQTFAPKQAQRQGVMLQPRLAVNAPGDTYEQEAERVAQRVMGIPGPQLPYTCNAGCECTKHRADQPSLELERLHSPGDVPSAFGQSVAPPIVHDILRSPGQPLDSPTRDFMESRFGHDFSRVRVHSDQQAARSAEAVAAQAYTVGHNVVFGAGRSAPEGPNRQKLLAHELGD